MDSPALPDGKGFLSSSPMKLSWPLRSSQDLSWCAHVLITRFNVGISDSDWTMRRTDLFERYTLPSVQAQSVQNFTWLLLCDNRTTGEARDRLQSFQNERTLIIWTDSDRAALKPAIQSLIKPNHTHLLTSRLDSDDVICSSFITGLQQAVRPRESMYFLNYTTGYSWHGGKALLRHHSSNPFISACEPVQGFRTVHCGPKHTQLKTIGRIYQLSKRRPKWCQILHQSNCVTTTKGLPPLSSWSDQSVMGQYGFPLQVFPQESLA